MSKLDQLITIHQQKIEDQERKSIEVLKIQIEKTKIISNLESKIFELQKFKEYILNRVSSIENSKEINIIKSDIEFCKKYSEDIYKRNIDLEQTNEYLMKNLKEQIEINNKLCQRIFEMKEEKFKDEKIDLYKI